jgi:DNA-binding transcriptional LysR family regulator
MESTLMPAAKPASRPLRKTSSSPDATRLAALPVALRRLRLRDLETLEWLGRYRSFARTAEAASISQPALSKWLRELEESLGLKLFERTSRRVEPTLYGDAMLDCIARILNDLREIEPAFEALRHGLGQPLTIGLLPNMDEQFLPGVLAWLREHDTPLQLNVRVDTLDRLLPLAQRRELDLLVCRLEATALASGLHVDELLRDDVVVVASHRHPLHKRSRVSWADTAAFAWIAPPLGSPMRTALEAEFARAGQPMPQILMESASHHTNRAVAQRMQCLFVTSATRASRSDAMRELRALPLKLSTIAPALGALSHEPRSAAVATVLEALRYATSEQRTSA